MSATTTNKIRKWMEQAATSNGSWSNPHDLHIDEISNDCKKNPQLWLKHALEYFKEAISVRDKVGLPFVVVLSYHLSEKNNPSTINSVIDITEDDLSHTPPSLYILKKGSNFFNEFMSGLEYSDIKNARPIYTFWYSVSTEPNNDGAYERNVYLVN